MKQLRQRLQRLPSGLSVAILLASVVLPVFAYFAHVSAVTNYQVDQRSITMSTSQIGTTATYTIGFTPVQAATELIVDFCQNSPLVGDSCTSTPGTDTPNIVSPTTSAGTASALTAHTLRVTGLTITGGSAFTITVTAGITNPSNIGTFFGRILTYGTGNSSSYTAGTPGTYVDYGGDALAATQNIVIQAKVFETLTFCVYNSAASGTCGTSAPSIWLGDSVTHALSTTVAYSNNDIKYNLATNAGYGVSVVMRGTTLCRTPTTDANWATNCQATSANAFTVTQTGTTPATINTAGAGAEQFGMCAGKGTSTAVTIATAYADANCSTAPTGTNATNVTFGFDGANTNAAAGSTVITSTGAIPSYTGNIAFAANIAPTTEAGLYSTSLNLVATPKY